MAKDVPSNDSGKASCRTGADAASGASGATGAVGTAPVPGDTTDDVADVVGGWGAAPGRMACRTMAFSCQGCNRMQQKCNAKCKMDVNMQ